MVCLLAAVPLTTPPPDDPAASPGVSLTALDGEEIYVTRCLSCHMADGSGVPGAFPPLMESEWVNGDKGVLIRVLLQGLGGEITVKGEKYGGLMPGWGTFLDDEQLAQVATYVRSNFGNDAEPVTTDEVARVREATKDRETTWTAEELAQEENQGVPAPKFDLFGEQ